MNLFHRCAPSATALTKEAALVAARELLGPEAEARYLVPCNGPVECVITAGPRQWVGNNWEQALRDAKKGV